jgi:hypothetical protein
MILKNIVCWENDVTAVEQFFTWIRFYLVKTELKCKWHKLFARF